jgi:hypothetical protein
VYPESNVCLVGDGVITTKDEELANTSNISNRGVDFGEKPVILCQDFRKKDHMSVVARKYLDKLGDNIEHQRANALFLSSILKSAMIPDETKDCLHI